MISVSRIYGHSFPDKGYRILVDRLWPRGVSKDKIRLDAWMKDIAPSNGLRKWFSHDPEKWDEFRNRYFKELDNNPNVEKLMDICRKNDVIFLFSSKEASLNNAYALKQYIEERLKGR
ncbi:MAG: DUF488 domain-containing protein [Thermoplasmata archaeon]